MQSFKNKVVIITGAASGIGRALSLDFAARGAQVIGTDINAKGLAETKELLKKQNKELITFTYDVTAEEQVQNFSKNVLEQFGHVDILINNAGALLEARDFRNLSQEDWEWMFKVNFWSVIYHTRAFLPSLLTRPEANLTNLSSVYGLMGMPEYSPYCASKFALRGFSESMHVELLATPVCVTSVHPGGIKTNIILNSRTSNPKATAKEAAIFAKKLAKTSPTEAARVIVKGIQKKKSRVLIGKDARMLDRFVRWMPSLRIPFFRKYTRLFNRRKPLH